MKTKGTLIIFFILIIITGLLLHSYLRSKLEIKTRDQSYRKTWEATLERDTIEYNYNYLEYLTNGTQLPESLSFEDPHGKSCSLKDLNIERPKILLYLEQTYCSACYSKILNLLHTKYPSICENDLIVICSFENFRSIIVYFNEMNLKIKLVNLIGTNLKLPMCSAKAPFLTVIDQYFVLNDCCLPLQGDPGKVEAFIKAFIQKNSD